MIIVKTAREIPASAAQTFLRWRYPRFNRHPVCCCQKITVCLSMSAFFVVTTRFNCLTHLQPSDKIWVKRERDRSARSGTHRLRKYPRAKTWRVNAAAGYQNTAGQGKRQFQFLSLFIAAITRRSAEKPAQQAQYPYLPPLLLRRRSSKRRALLKIVASSPANCRISGICANAILTIFSSAFSSWRLIN